MNKKELQIASFLQQNCNYAEYKNFFASINKDCEITNKYILEKTWRKEIIEKDLCKLNDFYTENKKNILIYKDDSQIFDIYSKIINCFSKTFDIKTSLFPKLHIVENLPHPFENKTWSAMFVDIKDETEFGIPWGIYFLRDTIINGYFQILLSHEIVHWIISEYSENQKYYLFVPWIEEGFADIVGIYILLLCNTIPEICIVNYLSTNRCCCKQEDMKHSYWNACKQVINIALTNGFDEIISIIKSGREGIINISYKKNTKDYTLSNNSVWQKLLKIIVECSDKFTLPIDEYAVYKTCFNTQEFKHLDKILGMPVTYVEENLMKLTNKNFLVYSNGKIYNYNKYICPNIKYIF